MRRGVAVVGRQEVSFYHLVRGSLSLSELRVCVTAQIKYYVRIVLFSVHIIR